MSARTDLLRAFDERLDAYVAGQGLPPGLAPTRRDPLLRQLVDSERRNFILEARTRRPITPKCIDPSDAVHFNPLQAAVLHHRDGDVEEALWLVFLFAIFGKSRRGGWTLIRRIYGSLGKPPAWTWKRVTESPEEFRYWIDANKAALTVGAPGFGNHRKFEKLSGWDGNGTGATVATYIHWSGSPPEQQTRIDEAVTAASGDPAKAFDLLYNGLGAVTRLGRLGRFDYLRMLGRLGFAAIEPGKAYFKDSSGPIQGAARLWGTTQFRPAYQYYEDKASVLAEYLQVGFDVIEDALCNWNKYPETFRHFGA